MCLPISFLLEAGFQECQLDMESFWRLQAILQVLASPEKLCEGSAPNFSRLFCGF